LRFDFTTLEAVAPDQVRSITQIVNNEVLVNRPVATHTMSYKDAVDSGAMALFGEKYGETVRMVQVDEFSKELCGGTHVARTGEIGPFVVTSEGSVASGVRRIEALTGTAAVELMLGQQRLVEELGRELRVSWTEVPTLVRSLQERARAQEREIERLRGQVAGAQSGDLVSQASDVDGIKVIAVRVSVENTGGLRQLGDRLRDSLQSGVIVLGTVVDDKPSLLAMVTPDLTGRGVRAGDIIRAAAVHINGRGGGRPELAEAGGKDASGLDMAIASIEDTVRELTKVG
jgi:alanyl-tRNA synthetase